MTNTDSGAAPPRAQHSGQAAACPLETAGGGQLASSDQPSTSSSLRGTQGFSTGGPPVLIPVQPRFHAEALCASGLLSLIRCNPPDARALQLEPCRTCVFPGTEQGALCVSGLITEFGWTSAGRAPVLTSRTRGSGHICLMRLYVFSVWSYTDTSLFYHHLKGAEVPHAVDLRAARNPGLL